jgi:hypothetical protein
MHKEKRTKISVLEIELTKTAPCLTKPLIFASFTCCIFDASRIDMRCFFMVMNE